MKQKFILIAACGTILLAFFSSCKKDPIIENEEELITDVELKLIPEGNFETVSCRFSDPDGDGGNPPVIETLGSLKAGVVYDGVLTFKNTLATPTVDITQEILTEADDHQVFYQVSSSLSSAISVKYADVDLSNYPLGLKTKFLPLTTGNGSITVILKHLPEKSAPGVSAGNPANAGGETDAEVVFSLTIE
jgi:hypothetical protein